MISRTFKFKDFNGTEREEEWRFHISQAELAELALSADGGLDVLVKRIIAEKNAPEISKLFKKIIVLSVGKVSDDGRRFMKSEDITREFVETEAYSQLYMELASDADKAAAFVNGVIPHEAAPNPIPPNK